MKAVILAGGLGTRIAEESDTRPKPMIEIGGKPLLWHIMKSFSQAGVTEFIICLGYKGYVIKEFFLNYRSHMADLEVDTSTGTAKFLNNKVEPWKITLVDTGADTMTGGRLKRIKDYVGDEDFFMTYGDGLSDVNIRELERQHSSSGKLATVTAVRPDGRFGVLSLDELGKSVDSFREKPDDEVGYINGGYFVLNPKVLDLIAGDATFWEKEPMMQLAETGQLGSFIHNGFWKPCDTLRDKRELEHLWSSGLKPWATWERKLS